MVTTPPYKPHTKGAKTMKAKRIVSILLTGSMLLSLLPVSALAAAPVFDAPAQTTAKKAAPLVQEADASRSTEEEAATRSSRDLDAENGTADSITIQLNAEGKPESEGDSEHWAYDYATSFSLNLRQGTFTLQPSSEPGAESALQTDLDIFIKMPNLTAAPSAKEPTTRAPSPMVPSNGRCTTTAPSPTVPSKGSCTTTKPSPTVPSKERCTTPAPSPAASLS